MFAVSDGLCQLDVVMQQSLPPSSLRPRREVVTLHSGRISAIRRVMLSSFAGPYPLGWVRSRRSSRVAKIDAAQLICTNKGRPTVYVEKIRHTSSGADPVEYS